MEKISGKKPIYKNKWVLLGGIIGFFVILFGSLCWCCCGGFLTGSDARERVRRDVGEGKSTVTAPYRATQLDNAEVDMPEADAVLTVPEEATSRLADKLEKGWVRCVLPPDLPPLRASLVDGPGRHIRDGVLTAMVDEPDGSYGLRPEPISPFETIHDAIRHMEALRAGEYAEFVQEDLDEVLQLNNEPVAIIRWWGAEPGQQGTCTVTDEVVLVDVPVRVVWNDGTPASNVTVTASDHQSPDGKTDAEGRTQLQSLLGAKIVISALEPNYGFRVDKTQLVKKGEACELVLDSLPPEQWAPQEVQARVQRSLDRGTNYNQYLHWPGRTLQEAMTNRYTAQVEAETRMKNGCKYGTFNAVDLAADRVGEAHDQLIDGLEEVLADDELSDEVRAQLSDWMEEQEERFDNNQRVLGFMEEVTDTTIEASGFEQPDCEAILAE